MSNSWLQWKFGVSPLIDDIDGGMRSLADYLYREDQHVRVKHAARRVTKKVSTSTGNDKYQVNTSFETWFLDTQSRVDQVIYRGGVKLILGTDFGPH